MKHVILGVLFFAAAVVLLRWKRPLLWAKIVGIFKKKSKDEARIHPPE